MSEKEHSNALANETSPYLLQHAHNPVQWYPWGSEALERARREDKPVLLSIGYSACHWCHVMAHESFEDERIAALMNDQFINIKVDREERPDLDRIYQTSHQLLTRRAGGWPLTMFLSPDDMVPFFGGTYFPPDSRYGMPGFGELLQRVAEFYRGRRDDIRDQNRSLMEALQSLQQAPAEASAAALDAAPLDAAAAELARIFDERHGGFGGAPKFPHPGNLEFLLQYADCGGEVPAETARRARHMALFSLECMALGGIYDQVGGGFSRYSVDDLWMIPHFEKMLYDNGPLLALYAEAWRATGDELFRRVALETAGWVLREMRSPDGGFYSSLDADSEGEEGKFYLWTREEARSLLDADEYKALARRFGLDGAANFEGRWHLRVTASLDDVAKETGIAPDAAARLIDGARAKLLEARDRRVHPGRDDKILTSWNGLMIRGLAVASLRLERDDFGKAAAGALDFIRTEMWRDGRLLATSRDGSAHLRAYLDDYAFVLDAILTLLQWRWSTPRLEFAVALAEAMLAQFEDAQGGGFFFTAHDHEKLIQRRRDFMDDALPSGNGVAAHALIRLGHLLGEPRYLQSAERTLRAAWPDLLRVPHGHTALLLALSELARPPRQVILRGAADTLREWRRICLENLDGRAAVYPIPDDAGSLPGVLGERKVMGEAAAYLCEGFTCKAPITEIDALAAGLNPSTPQ